MALPITLDMGELIQLSKRRAERVDPRGQAGRFFFALDDPFSYLTAERIERALGAIEWVPVLGPLSQESTAGPPDRWARLSRERMLAAEREAASLGLPLVEPHRLAMDSRRAARGAVFATRAGSGCAFALALMRLAFCGGFDISSVRAIREAADAAGLEPARVLAASGDAELDSELHEAGRALGARGVVSPPAISMAGTWFHGTKAVISAVAFAGAWNLADAPHLTAR